MGKYSIKGNVLVYDGINCIPLKEVWHQDRKGLVSKSPETTELTKVKTENDEIIWFYYQNGKMKPCE